MTDTNDQAGAPAPEPVLPQDAPAEPTTPQDPASAPEPTPAGGETDPAPSTEPDGKPKTGWQREKEKREQAERDRFKTQLELDQERQAREALEARLRKLESPDPTDPGPRPKLADHDSIEAFEAALDRWTEGKVASEGHKARQEATGKLSQEREQETRLDRQATLNARVAKARETRPDLDAILAPAAGLIDTHPVLSQYSHSSEHAPAVLYDLVKNHPGELLALTKLDPIRASWKLKDLEARLTAPPPPTPTTKAPPPVAPVGSQATTTKTLADLAADEDISAYVAASRRRGK